MILIGEKLNSSIPKTLEAFKAKDRAAVTALIEKQAAAGAAFLDVNTAICGGDELDRMLWVIGLVKENCGCGIMIDSTDPEVIARAVEAAGGRELILNSTTITDRFDQVVPLALESGAALVAMPIDDDGMPHTLEEKCAKIDLLAARLRQAGLPDGRVYIDVLVETLATGGESAKAALDAIRYVSERYPEMNTVCGLSNVSFGLPRRALINCTFAAAAVAMGLSSAILDPVSPSMQATLAAAKAVAGQDDYCMDYITYIRSQEDGE